MNKLLFNSKNFQEILPLMSTLHECKLARDLWPGVNCLLKGVVENYSLLCYVKSKRQAGLKGETEEGTKASTFKE